MTEVITPSVLWGGFSDTYSGSAVEIDRSASFSRYALNLFSSDDGDVTVDTEVRFAHRPTGNIIILVGSIDRHPQEDLVDTLTSEGYTVIIPDFGGVFAETKTVFPPSLAYGYYDEKYFGDVSVPPKDTCHYLYTKIARILISAIKVTSPRSEIVIMGLGRGTEIALQIAGTDKRIIGLALIGGAGYREYLGYPRYASTVVPKVEGDLMQWITAVSGTAYAKRITVPTVIAVGSNGEESDVDRLSSLTSMIEGQTTISISAGYRDSIDVDGFDTVLEWLDGIFLFSVPPKTPTMIVRVNDEGEIYGEIKADSCIKIKETRVKFSYGDNNHTTRFWRETTGAYVGVGEYIAKLNSSANLLFAYPEVEYANGFTACGTVVFADLTGKKLKKRKKISNPIVFQHPTENAFVEISSDPVILEGSIKENRLPIGLKGLRCDKGAMVSYSIGDMIGFDDDRLLQIDTYCERKEYTLSISLVDEDNVEYTAVRDVECSDTFSSVLFSVNSFKDKNMLPLDSWDRVNILTVNTGGITVNKIIFI